jgi:Tfp pilus tip-associated adhesin PilY1
MKGWYRDYDNGEKTANSPTVFNQRLRFGTYAPLGSSAGACAPLGEGRLNEIDALTGDLVPINGTVSQASDRYYSSFITHGYISTGQLIILGKNIFHVVVSDSRLQSVLVGNMGSATKIYWYLEPEQ